MNIILLTVGCVNYDCDINFYEPLKSLFKNVTRYCYLERIKEIGRRKMNQEIINIVKKQKPDYVFYIPYQDQIRDDTLDKIENSDSKIITWFCDDQWRFEIYSRFVAKHVFCSGTTDKNSYEKYKKLGFNVIKSQWAANHHYYRKLGIGLDYEVTFVGQNYGKRKKFIDFFKAQRLPIELFGRGFRKYVEFEDIIRIFNQSKINVNFSGSSLNDNIKQIKGRVFEVPMCGGFLLTEYTEGLEEYFEIGKEIESFKDKYEAVDKIKYYLKHDDKRREIANRGYIVCQERHSWEKRLKGVFNQLEKIESVPSVKKSFLSKAYDTLYEMFKRRNVS